MLSPRKELDGPSKLLSLVRGFSSLGRETERRIPVSSTAGSSFNLSMAMTGVTTFDSDIPRSRSLVIDFRTEPKALKGLLDVFGDTGAETGVAFLPGPNGRRERKVRNDGMPEPAVLGGVVV